MSSFSDDLIFLLLVKTGCNNKYVSTRLNKEDKAGRSLNEPQVCAAFFSILYLQC